MEELNDKSGIARCYNLFGIIYYYLQNYNLSLEYYNKALKINIEQDDKNWIAGNYNNIGMIHEKLGEYGLALEYYFKSLEANIELNNKNWIANNYGNIGSLYLETGNPKSLEYFQKRLQINTELNDLSGIAQSNYLIGRYYIMQDQFANAISHLMLGYLVADSIGNLYLVNNITKELSDAYASKANFKEALSFHEIHKQLNDSLYFEDNAQKITRLELQYKFRKDQQLNEINIQKTRLIRTSIALILGTVFLLILLFIAHQREKNKQNKLEQRKLNLENELLKDELKHKDKTFEDNVRYLMLKNDFITKVSERLIKEKPLFKKENQKIIEGIILDLQSSKDNEILQEFEVRFNQIYASFIERLNKCSQDLTPNEKKLCTFIKLKMSTKEISYLTGQTISSIETARTRLRKKLNLQDKVISLQTFLENL
jgi:tetratricopeptide (TPR) repeat protein